MHQSRRASIPQATWRSKKLSSLKVLGTNLHSPKMRSAYYFDYLPGRYPLHYRICRVWRPNRSDSRPSRHHRNRLAGITTSSQYHLFLTTGTSSHSQRRWRFGSLLYPAQLILLDHHCIVDWQSDPLSVELRHGLGGIFRR
jgi:hypothetical protein